MGPRWGWGSVPGPRLTRGSHSDGAQQTPASVRADGGAPLSVTPALNVSARLSSTSLPAKGKNDASWVHILGPGSPSTASDVCPQPRLPVRPLNLIPGPCGGPSLFATKLSEQLTNMSSYSPTCRALSWGLEPTLPLSLTWRV